MALLNLRLEDVVVGSTWRGLPEIDIDPDITSDLVEVYITFRESEWSDVVLTLDHTDGVNISDPVNNVFDTPSRVLPLRAGTWLFQVLHVFADGTRYVKVEGVQRLLP